jgi:hypothetical protein
MRINTVAVGSNLNEPKVEKSKIDKYFSRIAQDNKSFYTFATSSGKYVPSITYEIKVNGLDIFNEQYSRQQLILHKPARKFDDFKGNFITYSESFKDFLTNDKDCPIGLKIYLKTAYISAKIRSEKCLVNPGIIDDRNFVKYNNNEHEDSSSDISNVQYQADNYFLPNEIDELLNAKTDITENFNFAKTGSIHNPHQNITSNYDNLQTQTNQILALKLENISNPISSINPFDANFKQNQIIVDLLEHLLCIRKGIPSMFNATIHGVAGTGKSFVISIIRDIIDMFTGNKGSSLLLAPTGCSAGLINGSTIDSALSITRTNKPLTELSAKVRFEKQEMFKNVCAIITDEAFMVGAKLSGKKQLRINELFGDDKIHININVGDMLQLFPVKDSLSYGIPHYTDSIEVKTGYQSHITATNYTYILDEPMRQKDNNFFQVIQAIRFGNYTNFKNTIEKRHMMNLSKTEQDLFYEKSIFACVTNDKKKEMNNQYISTQKNVHIIKSRGEGTHNINKSHSSIFKVIPWRNFLCVGAVVKLTVNLNPNIGLYNGSRGKIEAIVYKNGYDPEVLPEFILISFDMLNIPIKYVYDPAFPKMFAVYPERRTCYKSCGCFRLGFPIEICKADTIHSLQGMTVSKTIDELSRIMLCEYNPKYEIMMPQLFYVGMTRTKDDSNLAINFDITEDQFEKIGQSNQYKITSNEIATLEHLNKVRINNKLNLLDDYYKDIEYGSKTDLALRMLYFLKKVNNKMPLKQKWISLAAIYITNDKILKYTTNKYISLIPRHPYTEENIKYRTNLDIQAKIKFSTVKSIKANKKKLIVIYEEGDNVKTRWKKRKPENNPQFDLSNKKVKNNNFTDEKVKGLRQNLLGTNLISTSTIDYYIDF